MPPEKWILIIILGVFGIINLLAVFLMARLFHLWLQAFLAGARVSLPALVLMHIRRAPVKDIVRLKIMAAQAGIHIPLGKIEVAALIGVDLERAVLALIRAKKIGMDVTWEEIITQDLSDQRHHEPSMD